MLLKAIPEPGSVFIGWESDEGISLTRSFKPQPGDIVRAVFEFKTVSLEDLDLNRTATKLSAEALQDKGFHDAHTGFQWNDGDNETKKFRPQGIAEIEDSNTNYSKRFLVVSWYGRTKEQGAPEDYANRGARVSFVDITDIDNPDVKEFQYRHVLLVDENYNTFCDEAGKAIHAGGLVYKDGKLHVPDDRKDPVTGEPKKEVHVFSIDSIQEVDPDDFYDYRYILKAESSYEVPIEPHFLSYDWDRDQVLVGTFHYPDKGYSEDPNLAWYTIGDVDSGSPFCEDFFDKMPPVG